MSAVIPNYLKVVLASVANATRQEKRLNSTNAIKKETKDARDKRRSAVKTPPTTQEMSVWSLGWEDPLEEEMTTHSGILAWETPWTEEPGRLQSIGAMMIHP